MATPTGWENIKYFTPKEFNSPDLPGSGEYIALQLVAHLDKIRERIGLPMRISSGVRTTAHNKAAGGVPKSAHCIEAGTQTAYAADVQVKVGGRWGMPSSAAFAIVQAALGLGIRRIGVAKTFVHLDVSPFHPKDVLWLYE